MSFAYSTIKKSQEHVKCEGGHLA